MKLIFFCFGFVSRQTWVFKKSQRKIKNLETSTFLTSHRFDEVWQLQTDECFRFDRWGEKCRYIFWECVWKIFMCFCAFDLRSIFLVFIESIASAISQNSFRRKTFLLLRSSSFDFNYSQRLSEWQSPTKHQWNIVLDEIRWLSRSYSTG